jgi:hypothetical protein
VAAEGPLFLIVIVPRYSEPSYVFSVTLNVHAPLSASVDDAPVASPGVAIHATLEIIPTTAAAMAACVTKVVRIMGCLSPVVVTCPR